jgi:hypothetical protein
MATSDHLNGDQFSEWFHGTPSAEKGRSIAANGLTSNAYGEQYGRSNYTLTTRKDEAGYFAGKHGAVATVRVPHDQASDYLTADPHEHRVIKAPPGSGLPDSVSGPHLSGIHKPIPPSMVHHVDYIDQQEN